MPPFVASTPMMSMDDSCINAERIDWRMTSMRSRRSWEADMLKRTEASSRSSSFVLLGSSKKAATEEASKSNSSSLISRGRLTLELAATIDGPPTTLRRTCFAKRRNADPSACLPTGTDSQNVAICTRNSESSRGETASSRRREGRSNGLRGEVTGHPPALLGHPLIADTSHPNLFHQCSVCSADHRLARRRPRPGICQCLAQCRAQEG